MTAVIQAHSKDYVPRLDESEIRGGIGLRARMRLDIGVRGAEELLRPVDRQLLDDIDEFAAAVVALARIAFGVLVGEHRALRSEHARTCVVLRCDKLDVLFLAAYLSGERRGELGIESCDFHRFLEHAAKPRCPPAGPTRIVPFYSRFSTTALHACARLPGL